MSTVDITVVTQPLTSSSDAASFISTLASDSGITQIDIAVAWVKDSGLRQVFDDLEGFVDRGGYLRIVTGISQGGATHQGLSGIAGLTPNAYVFHQPARTFHPKLYLGTGPLGGRFLVGSQNLTRGGLITNFEVGIIGRADAGSASDSQTLGDLKGYIDGLIADEAACKRLTPDTLTALLRDPHYLIGDEASSRTAVSGIAQPGEAWTSMFKKSDLLLRNAPSAGTPPRTGRRAPVQPRAASDSLSDDATVLRRWYKRLPASNVSRVGGNTNPQGHMTLTKGPRIPGQPWHPIDQGTYFRQIFFGDASWGPGRSSTSEVATVTVQVIARGIDLGSFSLEVEHNTSFESGQGNRSSFLHWGPALSEYLRRQVNHTGDVATLEKLNNDTYRLTMDESETGPFL